MRRLASTLAIAILLAALNPRAQSPAQQPVFRGGTDLVQIDVSVLDNKRHPVRGLTAADFTVLEDGSPREIQAFTEVYLPDRVQVSAAPWVRDVPSDAVSNQSAGEEGRLVIIMLDRSIPVGMPTLTAKKTAAAIVNQLGPGDLGAVVSSSGGATHNLTSDHARLLRAINQPDLSTSSGPESREVDEGTVGQIAPWLQDPNDDGRCLCGLCVLQSITRVADAVQGTARRRKVLFFIGSDLTLQATGSAMGAGWDIGCEVRLKDTRNVMFSALDRANLTVHSLDPTGLATVGPMGRASSTLRGERVGGGQSRDVSENLQRQGALSVLPDRTGGRTVMNTNAPDAMVSDIFRESDSYYLIGFRAAEPAANGKFHHVTVKTTRRGLDVHARNGYTAAAATDRTVAPAASNTVSESLRAALSGLLPANSVPVDTSAATFATPGFGQSAVVLTVGVGAFAESSSSANAQHGVPLEVVANAIVPGALSVGVARQTVELSWPAGMGTQDHRFDVLSRLDLPPGDYEIRVGVSAAESARTASVFAYVTVPPFASAPLSLSSIVVGATAGTLTAPKDFLSTLLPVVPTARRDFARTDKVVAFLRIYQGTKRSEPLLPVQLRSSIVDAQGKVVASESAVIDVGQFEKGRTADHYLALPLSGLAEGEYLLRIETEMGARTAGRAMRFSVR